MKREFLVVTMDDCKWCDRVKDHLKDHIVHEVDISDALDLMTKLGRHTVPQVFELIGNHDETVQALSSDPIEDAFSAGWGAGRYTTSVDGDYTPDWLDYVRGLS